MESFFIFFFNIQTVLTTRRQRWKFITAIITTILVKMIMEIRHEISFTIHHTECVATESCLLVTEVRYIKYDCEQPHHNKTSLLCNKVTKVPFVQFK